MGNFIKGFSYVCLGIFIMISSTFLIPVIQQENDQFIFLFYVISIFFSALYFLLQGGLKILN